MLKVLTIFGTRPEAIKLAPVISELSKYPHLFYSIVGLSGQHDKLLTQVLNIFSIKPDFNLKVMQRNQKLPELTASIVKKMSDIFAEIKPDIILVQGDTTTAFAAALAAFYQKIMIGHVEAGLRTEDKYQPFPEEINRRFVDQMSDFCFAPTGTSRINLVRSGIPESHIHITGNTVVDALIGIRKAGLIPRIRKLSRIPEKMILVTAHRRENIGAPLNNVFQAIRKLSQMLRDVHFVYPVHPNPNVHAAAHELLSGLKNVHLLKPLDYLSFVYLMEKSCLILTDSGGVQEEAPTLNKPVLILRNKTERPEIVKAGGAVLVGTDQKKIITATMRLINDKACYNKMANIKNPYGDGKAAQKIIAILKEKL